MLSPSAAALLDLWEHARRCPPPERALRLLAWALPDHDTESLADFDLGLRDWHLLRLRRALFGPLLAGQGVCPHCGERIEVDIDARALQDDAPLPAASCYTDGSGLRYRLPCSRDLISIAPLQDVDAAARALFVLCCIDAAEADAADFAEVEHGLSALAAERNLQLDLCCDLCGESWQLTFDPGAFCWEEIESRAQTLLDDVHTLASTYGWHERDILALSEMRRAAYLDRVQ